MAKKIAATAAKKKTAAKREILLEYSAPNAETVCVAGTFNNWNSNALGAKKDSKGNWVIRVALDPGKYEYKFVVDGSWLNDPHCRENIPNALGSANSVLVVK